MLFVSSTYFCFATWGQEHATMPVSIPYSAVPGIHHYAAGIEMWEEAMALFEGAKKARLQSEEARNDWFNRVSKGER